MITGIRPIPATCCQGINAPIRYRDQRGSISEGIPAQVLRLICSVWVRAHKAGVLGPSQIKIAEKAQVLLDALADVAIVALIDETTGYQKRRAHDALQRILNDRQQGQMRRGVHLQSGDGPHGLSQRAWPSPAASDAFPPSRAQD